MGRPPFPRKGGKPFQGRPPHGRPPQGGHAPQGPASHDRPMGRYDASPDGPFQYALLEMDRPFAFDANFARRLIRRDVNPKEAFTVRDTQGNYYRASVRELTDKGGIAVPYERMEVSPEPTIELTLACAVLGRQRMIFVAQKATELGVTRIVPLLTEHSVPKDGLEHEKAHAWPGQIIRAAKQCRRSSLPELTQPMPLDGFLLSSISTGADLRLCLDNIGGKAAPMAPSPKSIVLLVGPEGGFSDNERKLLEGKASSWILGGRILRAETAVMAGLTAVQLRWGDFKAGGGA